ncbi:methyltransferase family protein [Larkinella arboricola]|uniref:Methyltransferase family protein n=1 Tax=Larkinella arboricola TaxID=643671 RepID=A0A327WMA7_LARAB|nr:class I SAM-dependent methyltransferase [Larkinella arboricola]RAJ93069.1 methyltransferase family protein [Larkinella arboricola]
MKTLAKALLDYIPYIRNMRLQLEQYQTMFPPGHFYSPIVNVEELTPLRTTLFSKPIKPIKGIDLRKRFQYRLLQELALFYPTIPFPTHPQPSCRYYYHNDVFSFGDAIMLHTMMRHFQPKQIIEVGSGFSSAVMLDTREIVGDEALKLTFIDPKPERLLTLLRPDDWQKVRVLEFGVQSIPVYLFETLQSNDILFIDSTHVAKTGSDVNYIFFDILPNLNSGVIIHFHDIFYPFEYPEEWVLGWKGFGWNESYMLRNFLMYNHDFEILLFNSFLHQQYPGWFAQNMPLFLNNPGGSLWLRKK